MPRIRKWINNNVTLKKGVKRSDDVMASITHAVGFLAALVAMILMLIQVSGNGRALFVSLVYGLAMCAVFAASAIYHGLKPSTAKRVFRLLDHSTIYLLIAGTYTPYAAAMGESGNKILLAVWGLCFVGLVLNFLLWDRLPVLHVAIYLLMGWVVVFFRKDLFAIAPIEQIRWMFTGGVFYTAGVFFYSYKRIPHSHVYWHLFVIGGAAGLHVGIIRYALPGILG